MYRYFNLLLELANVLKILIYFFTVFLISTVVVAEKYLKKEDKFKIVDVFTYMGYDSNLQNQDPDNGGLSNSRTIPASSVVWIIAK